MSRTRTAKRRSSSGSWYRFGRSDSTHHGGKTTRPVRKLPDPLYPFSPPVSIASTRYDRDTSRSRSHGNEPIRRDFEYEHGRGSQNMPAPVPSVRSISGPTPGDYTTPGTIAYPGAGAAPNVYPAPSAASIVYQDPGGPTIVYPPSGAISVAYSTPANTNPTHGTASNAYPTSGATLITYPTPHTTADAPRTGPNPYSPYSPASKSVPGREEFVQVWWKTEDLLSEFERLQFALRTVGGCGPGIEAIHKCYDAFRKLRRQFGCNTVSLFPYPADRRFERYRTKDDSYLARFPSVFSQVADALSLLEKALGDYSSLYYESKTMHLLTCLRERFKNEAEKSAPSRGRYYYSASQEQVKQRLQMLLRFLFLTAVNALQKDLQNYCDKGIPVISSTQKVSTTRYLNLTTIATFLSAVTATLLQITAEETEGVLHVAVNTFLFSSLTFSIASAINSLLAISWFKSVVREPGSYLPMWLNACLNTAPMLSLVVSIALFVIALCLFVFSSSQHLVTSITTVSFAGFYTLTLLGLASWFILEKWHFRHVAGSAGEKLTKDSFSMAIIESIVIWTRAGDSGYPAGVQDPSKAERGPADSGASYLPEKSKEHEEWDAFANRLLSDVRPPWIDEHGRTPRSESRRDDGREYEGRSHSRRDAIPAPIVPGHAPSEGPTESVHGRADSLRRPTHADDDRPPVPVFAQLPPVDSHTYETALFLPRNDEGEFVDADIRSDSGESDESEDWTDSNNGYYGMGRMYSPPLMAPGLPVPNPLPVSHSEQVMVIPTNPPTYVVPPGSYVAYGTAPNIGPSTQAGTYSFYNPNARIQVMAPIPTPIRIQPPSATTAAMLQGIPFPPSPQPPSVVSAPVSQAIPPPTPFIPARREESVFSQTETRSRSPSRTESRTTHDPRRDSWPDGLRAQMNDSYDRINAWVDDHGGYNSYEDNRRRPPEASQWGRTVPSRQDTISSVGNVAQSRDSTHSTSRPASEYSRVTSMPPARRSSSGSHQVRFAKPLVTGRDRGWLPPEVDSTRSRATSTTTIFSEPLTTEPEELDDGQNSRTPDKDSRGPLIRLPSSSLDGMQERYRRTTVVDHPRDTSPHEAITTRRTTVETVTSGEEDPPRVQRPDESVRISHISGSSTRVDTPSARLSTIDEGVQATPGEDGADSDSDGGSVITAPETTHSSLNR